MCVRRSCLQTRGWLDAGPRVLTYLLSPPCLGAAFAGVSWLAFRALSALFALFGPAQPLALALVAAYLALSFYLYSRPVDALQVRAVPPLVAFALV